jgi:choice-of-anchor B domain-containing protein
VSYDGPDTDHAGREICFGSNETALSIADVSDKQNPVSLAIASYPNVAYTHQGWLTEDMQYFYMNDEGDEASGLVTGTRTLIWDVSDLDDPVLVGEYLADNTSIDHNLYIKGNLIYESNYVSGLRVLDITDPVNPVEVGYFDTVPYGDNSPGTGGGSWSNFPYFESGIVVVTSGREGLFVLKKRGIDI